MRHHNLFHCRNKIAFMSPDGDICFAKCTFPKLPNALFEEAKLPKVSKPSIASLSKASEQNTVLFHQSTQTFDHWRLYRQYIYMHTTNHKGFLPGKTQNLPQFIAKY